MTTTKVLQRALLDAIGQAVSRDGFTKRKGQAFYKKCSFGQLAFHLTFIEGGYDFDITADVAIRFDDVEELLNTNNTLLSSSEKSETHTIGAQLGSISKVRQTRWTIASSDDVEPVAHSIMDAFREIGLPYLEEMSDKNTALRALSSDKGDSWLYCPFDDARAKAAVALGLLLNGTEFARKLAESKLAFLRERKDRGLASFRDFLVRIGVMV